MSTSRTVTALEGRRVALVCEDEAVLQRQRATLQSLAMICETHLPTMDCVTEICNHPPDAVIVDGSVEGISRISAAIAANPSMAYVPVIALTERADDETHIGQMLDEGACVDILNRDCGNHEMRNRLGNHMALRRQRERAALERDHRETLLSIHEAIRSSPDPAEFLDDVVREVSQMVPSYRCGAIVFSESGDAIIAASADDPNMRGFVLSRERYPELMEMRARSTTLRIDNPLNSPITSSVREILERVGTTASLAVPITHGGEVLGALFLRATIGDPGFSERDAELIELVARTLGPPLANMALLERIQAERETEARKRAGIEKQLKEHKLTQTVFERIPVGLASIDIEGVFTYVNRAAPRILGRPREAIVGHDFMELVQFAEQPRGARIAKPGRARRTRAEDLQVSTDAGPMRLIEFIATPLPRAEDGQILVLRDVTEERQQGHEVERTRDFLQSIIQNSGDGIVASDIDGRIILFNRAAENLFGYSPREVDGTDVRKLYPEGGAAEIMAALRSDRYGGRGKAMGLRAIVLDRHGEEIPVGMSAAILYHEGRETSVVGIFHDLRPRQAIEDALAESTYRIRELERLATLAQVASEATPRLMALGQAVRESVEGLDSSETPEGLRMALLARLLESSEMLDSMVRGFENARKLADSGGPRGRSKAANKDDNSNVQTS